MRFIVDIDDIGVIHLETAKAALKQLNNFIGVTVTRTEKDGREGETQPMPTIIPGGSDIQSAVIDDLVERRQLGINRYGTALQANNGRDALADAYGEVLDLACYLKQRLIEDAANNG